MKTVMKKLLTPFILFAVSSILLSSCSGPSTIALTKRHYRTGYYVDWAGKKPTTTTSRVIASAKSEPKIALIAVANTEGSLNISSAILIPEKSNRPQKSCLTNHINAIANKKHTPTAVNQNEGPLNINGINSTTATADVRIDANISFIVIVLCAIFLPPLGVALMYGIHLYFWVDLILTLLFFIPGMIFALIVVLM
jgi:uncharacterized membrane protein YqaE (UPF0057 family)